MGLRNFKAQWTKQDGVFRMHNYADMSMIMRNREPRSHAWVENGEKLIFFLIQIIQVRSHTAKCEMKEEVTFFPLSANQVIRN